MEDSFTIRPFEPQEWPTYRDVRLRSLAESPQAFCSTYASEQQRTSEEWAARLAAAAVSGKDYPLVAELDGVAVGLLYAKVDADDDSVVNIFQVWVAPEGRGRGIAAALVREAVRWARARHARVVRLAVIGETAARRLYLREGFRDYGTPEPRPDSPLLEQSMELQLS
ncbi:MAG TPA: GNAT family N-acetyltransferase [Telluria sp.]|nr:GNAT family N-acetyltransferase [Telluria sp.]